MNIDLAMVDLDDLECWYHRHGIDRWPLDRLAQLVEAAVDATVDHVDPEDESFYLHAPLEFMARMELMTSLGFASTAAARIQLLSLGVRCAHLSPPAPHLEQRQPSAEGDVKALLTALRTGDRAMVDQLARPLDHPEVGPALVPQLAPFVSPSLEAASHGVIYLQYLRLVGPKARKTSFLSRMLRELAVEDNHQRIAMPPSGSAPEPPLRLPPRPSPLAAPRSIAGAFALVEDHGLLAPWRGWADRRDLPQDLHVGLQRLAASAMIFGGDDDVQFGWTHALSIPQATLDLADFAPQDLRPSLAYIAVAHLCSSWYPVEAGPLELAHPTDHKPWSDSEFRGLVGRALAAQDAHRVKYLVCARRALEVDPLGGPVYAAATRRLDSWWEARTT